MSPVHFYFTHPLLVVVESGVYVRTFFVSQEVSSSPHGVVRMIRPNKVFHFLTTAAATQPIFQNAIITRLPNRVKIWWHWPQTRCSYFSKKNQYVFICRPKEAVSKGISIIRLLIGITYCLILNQNL